MKDHVSGKIRFSENKLLFSVWNFIFIISIYYIYLSRMIKYYGIKILIFEQLNINYNKNWIISI